MEICFCFAVCILSTGMKISCKTSLNCGWKFFTNLSKYWRVELLSLGLCLRNSFGFEVKEIPWRVLLSHLMRLSVSPPNYLKKLWPRAGKWFAQVQFIKFRYCSIEFRLDWGELICCVIQSVLTVSCWLYFCHLKKWWWNLLWIQNFLINWGPFIPPIIFFISSIALIAYIIACNIYLML